MLKRTRYLLLLPALAWALTGCGPQAASAEPPPAPPAEPPKAAEPAAAPSLTLGLIKQAALDAGYIVSDGHQYILLEDIIGGLTIEIVADGAHTLYSIAECGSEEAAIENAEYIDSRGYAISLRNGRFFSSYDAENPGTERRELLRALLAGDPLPAPPYPAGGGQEPAATPKPSFGRQEGAGYLAGGDMHVTIIAMERQDFDGQSGVIITYEMQNLSGAVMDTMGALYVKVEQDYSPLLHPDTYEPTYYVIDKLEPGESLVFYEEYILDSEDYPVKIEIQEYGADFSNATSAVYQTFTLD